MNSHPKIRDVGLLPWFYYWHDLYGPSGTPANSKVLGTVGFYVAWVIGFVWVLRAATLGADFVAYVALIFGITQGLDGWKAATKVRNSGSEGGALRPTLRAQMDDPRTDDER